MDTRFSLQGVRSTTDDRFPFIGKALCYETRIVVTATSSKTLAVILASLISCFAVSCVPAGGTPDSPQIDARVKAYVADTIRDVEGDKPTITSVEVRDTTLTLVVNPAYERWWRFLSTASASSLSPSGVPTPSPRDYADVLHGVTGREFDSWQYWGFYVAVFENALQEERHFKYPVFGARVRLVDRRGNLIYKNVVVVSAPL